MRRLLTKESREAAREFEFNSLIAAGYLRETYKELDFFTRFDGKYYALKVFKGTAANHLEYINYRTEERRAEIICNYKANYESRLKFKAEQKAKGYSTSHANAAASLKAELKAAYPHIKFSVTSEGYSGGDSVRVSWENGPTTAEVEKISGKYQYGQFNGMEDIYENTNSRNDIPQAKYVFESRSMSDELKEILLPDAQRLFNADHYSNVRNENDFLRRIFQACTIPAGAKVTGISSTGVTCGLSQPETFYKLAYTVEGQQEEKETTNFELVVTEKGIVNIVDYSAKAIAVIGDTIPIKEKLKALGGKFNKYLSCGAGWIFPKTKLDEVTNALNEKQPETKEAPAEPDTLKNEVCKMIELFAEIDIKAGGKITDSVKECARVQNVSLSKYEEEQPQYYNSMQDINDAVKSGKVISLLNLSKLVNNV